MPKAVIDKITGKIKIHAHSSTENSNVSGENVQLWHNDFSSYKNLPVIDNNTAYVQKSFLSSSIDSIDVGIYGDDIYLDIEVLPEYQYWCIYSDLSTVSFNIESGIGDASIDITLAPTEIDLTGFIVIKTDNNYIKIPTIQSE